MTRLTTGAREHGQRLDRWLSGKLADLSRSRIQSLIRSGHITVNGRAVKPHHKLAAGSEIRVEMPPPVPLSVEPEDIPLTILHEDADIIVINKPAGQVVHPAPGHAGGTLVNALLHHCRDLRGIGGELRPGIVHRLDKDTSGVLVVAKNEGAMRRLANQFKQRRVEKEYLALVRGRPTAPAGRIETLIGRSEHDRQKMSVRPRRGRTAVTHYRTVETFKECSLLRIRIETGRTHQIRVHMKHMGLPVIGDARYGRGRRRRSDGLSAARQMLHAERLVLSHPRTGERMEFRAPLPADMTATLEALRTGSRVRSSTAGPD